MARLAILGIWLAVGLMALLVVAEEVVPGTSVPAGGQSAGKRRVGGVIKYKKVSVKLNPVAVAADVSAVLETVASLSQENNKTSRRTKPKSSPQTMIYKPTKATAKINPAILADEETTTTTTTTTARPPEEKPSSTTTTEKPRVWIFASTVTEEPDAFTPAAPVGFIRPTARNRVRVVKRPVTREPEIEEEEEESKSKVPVRLMTRVKMPGRTTTTTIRPVTRSTTTRTTTTTPTTTPTTTTTTEEPTTTSTFIRLTRRPSKSRPVTISNEPEEETAEDVEHLRGESSIRKGLTGIRKEKPTYPPISDDKGEGFQQVEDQEKIRYAKYEEEKAKQIERLKENRPVVRRPLPEEEPPRARIVPSEPAEKQVHPVFEDLIDFVRPPPSNYGQRIPEVSIKKPPSAPATPEVPKLLYTPPVYEYRPPAGYLTGGYLPRTRIAASQHHIRIPPVTYEPPHEEFSPPSPPPPARLHVPPTDDYRPSAKKQVDGAYQGRPEEERRVIQDYAQTPETYSRLVAVGQPAVNELPYPPAVEGSYRDDDSKPYQQLFRVKETVYASTEKARESGRLRPYVPTPKPVDIDYDHSEKTFSRSPNESPRYEAPTRVFVRPPEQPENPRAVYESSQLDNPFIPKSVNPYAEKPHHSQQYEKPSAVKHTDQGTFPQVPYRVTVTTKRPYHQTIEPRGPYIQSYLEPVPKYVTSRYEVRPPSLSEQPRVVAEPNYRPYVVIEKPITVTVRPHGEPVIAADYRTHQDPHAGQDNGFYAPVTAKTYAARPYHQGVPQLYYPQDSPFREESNWPAFPQSKPSPQYQRTNRSLDHGPHSNRQQEGQGTSDGAAVRGQPGRDYPILQAIPDQINFDCNAVESPGYYADPDTRCQVFHVCQTNHHMDSFLCPNGTIFNQKVRVCDWWHNVKCGESAAFYHINSDLNDQLQPSIYEIPGR